MNNHISRILRIGLVNSGMFDLLELNLDVQAVHLVGANNVGKTSLITLIQFLYFHDVRDITFPKSSTESLAFYFRRAGSYILFEVRTLNGTRRTVGFFGTGTAKSREIFVFDGGFSLQTFLDDTQRVLPLKQVQVRLFKRNLRRFARFADYETALLGRHSDGTYNVQMFDLKPTNFRLLRALLQDLLQLKRITSAEVRQSLISIAKSTGIKTQISVAEDENENRKIQDIQRILHNLRTLQPLIEHWQVRKDKLAEVKQQFETESERLYHISTRYLALLQTQHDHMQTEYQDINHQLSSLQQQHDTLLQQQTHQQNRHDNLSQTLKKFTQLQDSCKPYSQVHTTKQRDQLISERIKLQALLNTIQPGNLTSLKRQQRQRKQEQTQIVRQMEQRTLQQVWREANFTSEEHILLTFLLSEQLISLPTTRLTDQTAFVVASRQAVSQLDAAGTFNGWGLNIPRATWYVPVQDQETLAERLTRVENELRDLANKIEIAEDRARKETELRKLVRQVQQHERILQQFTALAQLESEYGDPLTCQEQLQQITATQATTAHDMQAIVIQLKDLRQRSETLHVQLADNKKEYDVAQRTHHTFPVFESACPADVLAMLEETLHQEYHFSQKRREKNDDKLTRFQRQLDDARIKLAAYYDRETSNLAFEQWVSQKLNVAHEIANFEAQLYDSYTNLITRMRGELDKLLRAFDVIKAQVAALNNNIRKVRISNIKQIKVRVEQSGLVDALKQINQQQLDMFSLGTQRFTFEQAQTMVEDYLSQIRTHGMDLQLSDMFSLEFSVTFHHDENPITTTKIQALESHGTEIGVKVVLYLGLIRLLQGRRRLGSRLPFFLDEVGGIDQHNLKQLINYCEQNNFLPIFASPEIRDDIPYSYIFRRAEARSTLVNEIIITPELHAVLDDAA